MKKFFSISKNENKVYIKEIDLSTQSFSGTDYSKYKDDLGIVFPYDVDTEVKNAITSSSIIDHHDDDNHLIKHTEVRVCNKEKDKLVYEELESASIVLIDQKEEQNSQARQLFFEKSKEKELLYFEANGILSIKNELTDLINVYTDFKYTFVDVLEENVKVKYNYPNSYYSNISYGTQGKLFDFEEEDKEIDIDKEMKLDRITSKWSDLFKLCFSINEIESMYIEYNLLREETRRFIGGILEFVILDALNINIFDKSEIEKFRSKYKYDKMDIEKSSKEVVYLIDGIKK